MEINCFEMTLNAMSCAVSVTVIKMRQLGNNIEQHWYSPLMGRVKVANPPPIDVYRKLTKVNMFVICFSNCKHFWTLFK